MGYGTIFWEWLLQKETVAEAKLTDAPACFVCMASYRVAHTYLFKVLKQYGFSEWIGRIRQMYDTETFSAQIKGHNPSSTNKTFDPTRMPAKPASFCPMPGTPAPKDCRCAECRPKQCKNHLTVVANADIIIILRSSQEVQVISVAIRTYEAALRAVLNTHKCKAMALDSWSTATPMMGIAYHEELRILGNTLPRPYAPRHC